MEPNMFTLRNTGLSWNFWSGVGEGYRTPPMCLTMKGRTNSARKKARKSQRNARKNNR